MCSLPEVERPDRGLDHVNEWLRPSTYRERGCVGERLRIQEAQGGLDERPQIQG